MSVWRAVLHRLVRICWIDFATVIESFAFSGPIPLVSDSRRCSRRSDQGGCLPTLFDVNRDTASLKITIAEQKKSAPKYPKVMSYRLFPIAFIASIAATSSASNSCAHENAISASLSASANPFNGRCPLIGARVRDQVRRAQQLESEFPYTNDTVGPEYIGRSREVVPRKDMKLTILKIARL
jgi:hypothetical protein